MSQKNNAYEVASAAGNSRHLRVPTHTHTHTALRRLRVAIVCAVMGLFNLGLAVPGWANTFGIVYKHSTSNAGTVWRMIIPRTTQAGAGVYPNPAVSWISMANNEALSSYDICDATGRIVRKGGPLASGEMINLDGLTLGFYLLHAQGKNGVMSTYKFTIK